MSRLGSMQPDEGIDATRPDGVPIHKNEDEEPPTPNPLSATSGKRISLTGGKMAKGNAGSDDDDWVYKESVDSKVWTWFENISNNNAGIKMIVYKSEIIICDRWWKLEPTSYVFMTYLLFGPLHIS